MLPTCFFRILLLHRSLELRSLMIVVEIFDNYKQHDDISYLAFLSSNKKIEKVTASINLDRIL